MLFGKHVICVKHYGYDWLLERKTDFLILWQVTNLRLARPEIWWIQLNLTTDLCCQLHLVAAIISNPCYWKKQVSMTVYCFNSFSHSENLLNALARSTTVDISMQSGSAGDQNTYEYMYVKLCGRFSHSENVYGALSMSLHRTTPVQPRQNREDLNSLQRAGILLRSHSACSSGSPFHVETHP